MGSPAFIGIQRTSDGPIVGVFCHHGYFDLLGRKLVENYQDAEKVQELVDLGNLSTVGPTPTDAATVSYVRDMGRRPYENCKIACRDLAHLREVSDGRCYCYFIYKPTSGWHVSESGRFLHPLDDALEQAGVEIDYRRMVTGESESR